MPFLLNSLRDLRSVIGIDRNLIVFLIIVVIYIIMIKFTYIVSYSLAVPVRVFLSQPFSTNIFIKNRTYSCRCFFSITEYGQRSVRENSEIKKAKLDENIKLLNRDEGSLVSTNTWRHLSTKMIGTGVARKRKQDISDVQ